MGFAVGVDLLSLSFCGHAMESNTSSSLSFDRAFPVSILSSFTITTHSLIEPLYYYRLRMRSTRFCAAEIKEKNGRSCKTGTHQVSTS